jgi:hypothetical protein
MAKNFDSIALASLTMLALRPTTASSYTPRTGTVSRGKDDNASIDEDKDATSKAGDSKCADELEQSNPRADQKRPIIVMTSSSESTSTTSSEESAGYNNDALSERSAALSIKRSFERLSKIDLSVDRTHHEPIVFYSGWGLYDREWSQEEKDDLVAFAKKYIIRGGGDKNEQHDNDGRAKKGRTL